MCQVAVSALKIASKLLIDTIKSHASYSETRYSLSSSSMTHSFVTSENAKTLIPQCEATRTSGIVLMPTASTPQVRSIRSSATVSAIFGEDGRELHFLEFLRLLLVAVANWAKSESF